MDFVKRKLSPLTVQIINRSLSWHKSCSVFYDHSADIFSQCEVACLHIWSQACSGYTWSENVVSVTLFLILIALCRLIVIRHGHSLVLLLLLNGGLLREEAIFFIIIVDKAVFITATMGHPVVAIHLLVHVFHLGQVWLEDLFELLGYDFVRSLDVILALKRYHRWRNAIFCH